MFVDAVRVKQQKKEINSVEENGELQVFKMLWTALTALIVTKYSQNPSASLSGLSWYRLPGLGPGPWSSLSVWAQLFKASLA